jgi:hypothetical protein
MIPFLMIPRIPISAYIIAALVVAIGAVWGYGEFRARGLERDVATARAETATTKTSLAQVTANRDALKSTVEDQNRAIGDLRRVAKQGEASAHVKALEALRDGEKRRADIGAATASGPEAMNLWLRDALHSP